jgi:hypothetical protein
VNQSKERKIVLKLIKEKSMKRQIGTIGTTARVITGAWLVGDVLYGHMVQGPFRPLPWLIGLVIFPALFLTWQWARARHSPSKLKANGPIASTINIIIFFYFLLWPPASIAFMTDAVLIFYGVSMLIAALRGYAGCESLAISNWLLKRDDQLGCLFFSPIDFVERKLFIQSNKEFEYDKQTK